MKGYRQLPWLLMMAVLASAAPAWAAESDQYLPNGVQFVTTINVKQILSSSLVKDDLVKAKDEIKKGAAQQTLDALGFDVFKDLDTVSAAGVTMSDPENVVVIAKGRFDIAKFKSKASEVAKDQGDTLKIHKSGGNEIYEVTVPDQKPGFVALVDANTIVASQNKDLVAEALDKKAGKKKGALGKGMQELLDKRNAKQSISIVALGPSLERVPFGDTIENVTGGITLTDDLQTNLVIRTKDADSAKGLAAGIKDGIDQGKNFASLFAQQMKELAVAPVFLDALKVDDKDNTVTLTGKVSKEAIEKARNEK